MPQRSLASKQTTSSSQWTLISRILPTILLFTLLSACSSDKPAEPAKPEVKPAELLSGRSAFWKTYPQARAWSADSQPYRIESSVTSEGNGQDGKWAIWNARFGSPSKKAVKPYQWSGSALADSPSRGVNPGTEDSYSPTNETTHIFDVQFLKIDTDAAFATAQKHGGDKIIEKDPKTPVTYVCDWNHNTNQLVWHVIYGASRDTAKLTVAVNASTGDFIRVEK